MKKLLLLCSLTLVLTFTGVFGDTWTYDIVTVENVGYNTHTGERDTNGYYTITNKMKVATETITIDAVDNFHYLVFFNKNNRVIGFMTNPNTNSLNVADSYDLGDITSTTITVPEGAHSFAFQGFDYIRYVEDKLAEIWPDSYTVTTDKEYTIDDMYDTVYTANGNEYSLFDMFEVSDIMDYNLIENGDFSTDTVWYVSDATYTHQNGYVTVTPTAISGGIRQNNSASIITNNIYYLAYDYKSSALTNDISFGLAGYNTILNIYSTNWNTVSGLWTSVYTGSGSTWRFNYLDTNLIPFDLDNVMTFDLTALTSAGDEPTADQFEEIMKAWEWINVRPDFYSLMEYLPSPKYTAPDPNPWTDLFDTDGSYNHVSYPWGLVINSWEWTATIDGVDTGYIEIVDNDDTRLEPNDDLFYWFYMQLDNDPFDAMRFGITGDSFYYNDFTNTNHPFTEPDDTNHFTSGLVTNNGSSLGHFKIEYDYDLLIGQKSDFTLMGFAFNTFKTFGSNDLTYTEVYNILNQFNHPNEYNPLYDESYSIGNKRLSFVYSLFVEDGFDEPFGASDLESITVSYDFTPPDYTRDVDDDTNSYLSDVGLNDAQSKFIIGVSIIIIVTLIVGITTKSGAIVILLDIILYLTFVFLGWFPMWVAVMLGLAVVIIFGFNISKGGSIND